MSTDRDTWVDSLLQRAKLGHSSGQVATDLFHVRESPEASNAKRLGTAQWMDANAVSKLSYPLHAHSKRIWIGESRGGPPLGYEDDRHVFLVSGSRSGKGTGVIIPNLCRWPGSCVVIDPKGENATITAERRGDGSAYAHGMGQKVYNLDPFGEATLDPSLKARFNPLDMIDPAPNNPFAVDDASLIAASIVVRENQNEPLWEDAARNLIKGLILYVLVAPEFAGRRNLVTVRQLITRGHWLAHEALERARKEPKAEVPAPFKLLWTALRSCGAFNGVVSGIGTQFFDMTEKTRLSVLFVAARTTDFLESVPMQKVLEASDFKLNEIKTDPKGVTIYLTLPRRHMGTHSPWLRLMVSLAVSEMERIKGPPAVRTSDGKSCPTLFVLDEFAGLRRMEVVEHATAQGAGFGIKFLFVVQHLPQLKEVYKESWETYVSSSGLKLFFHIEDGFTREYVSRLMGEHEIRTRTQSGSESQSESTSRTKGRSTSQNQGTSQNKSGSSGTSETYRGLFTIFPDSTSQGGTSWSTSTSDGFSHGTSFSESDSHSTSKTSGWNEGIQKRALAHPDEIGRLFAKVDDPNDHRYPGLVLALMPGQDPLAARRTDYWRSPHFEGLFGPHPDHGPIPTLVERELEKLARRAAAEREAARRVERAAAALPLLSTPAASKNTSRSRNFFLVLGTGLCAAILCGVGFWALFIARSNPKVVISSEAPPALPVVSVPSEEPSPEGEVTGCAALLQRRIATGTSANETANRDNVNVRSGPGRDCAPIDLKTIKPLTRGVSVRVVSTADDGWKEVEAIGLDGKTVRGFVLGQFLGPAATAPSVAPPKSIGALAWGSIADDGRLQQQLTQARVRGLR
jgi:type IV secretory pathway TraG/TraD family ATPase VirD4